MFLVPSRGPRSVHVRPQAREPGADLAADVCTRKTSRKVNRPVNAYTAYVHAPTEDLRGVALRRDCADVPRGTRL